MVLCFASCALNGPQLCILDQCQHHSILKERVVQHCAEKINVRCNISTKQFWSKIAVSSICKLWVELYKLLGRQSLNFKVQSLVAWKWPRPAQRKKAVYTTMVPSVWYHMVKQEILPGSYARTNPTKTKRPPALRGISSVTDGRLRCFASLRKLCALLLDVEDNGLPSQLMAYAPAPFLQPSCLSGLDLSKWLPCSFKFYETSH